MKRIEEGGERKGRWREIKKSNWRRQSANGVFRFGGGRQEARGKRESRARERGLGNGGQRDKGKGKREIAVLKSMCDGGLAEFLLSLKHLGASGFRVSYSLNRKGFHLKSFGATQGE